MLSSRISLFLFMTIAAGAVYGQSWHNPKFLLTAFQEVALKNEYASGGGYVRRWEQPVRVWIDHQVADRALHTELVSKHIEHLSEITGLSIILVQQRAKSNLQIMFTRQSAWAHQVESMFGSAAKGVVHGAVCMANIRENKQHEIVQAGIIIPVDQARMHGKLVSCVVEELTQVLGLPNDSERVYPSIFNDKTPDVLLTGLDYLLLKMLYHPKLHSGMDSEQVSAQLQTVIRQWQSAGTIATASRDVKSGQLYTLLGY